MSDLHTDIAELETGGWTRVHGRDAIAKEFRFRNFIDAFGWMTRVAMHAERLNHHPEWENIYATVRVVLATHDTGGISAKDIKLARIMDRLHAPPATDKPQA